MRSQRIWVVVAGLVLSLAMTVGPIEHEQLAEAQIDGPTQPVVQHPLSPVGETEVRYFNDGVLTSETRIPEDSMFNTSGAGSGGDGVVQPCYTFEWSQVEPNPHPRINRRTGRPRDPTIRVDYSQESRAWTYTEITPTGTWTPESQGQLIAPGDGEPGGIDLNSAYSWGERYYALNAPLAMATRRFDVHCGIVPGYPAGWGAWGPEGPLLGSVEVPMSDSFWNPLVRLGVLWGMVELPPFRVITPPEVATYGGLVVNMPTWLQIEADAWRPWFTAVDQYRGWYSQLGLFPDELRFEVVGPGGRTVRCAPGESAASAGAIPGFPDDLPRYFELGQLGWDCTWVPQERGQVTIRARVTYRVLLTISGFSEWLSPYVWYSDPLTLPVGELRFRNVTPEGGIGG